MLVKNFQINFGKKKRKMGDCQRTNTKSYACYFSSDTKLQQKEKNIKR